MTVEIRLQREWIKLYDQHLERPRSAPVCLQAQARFILVGDGRGRSVGAPMKSERGQYRAIYTVLIDTPGFIDLGPAGQLVWFHLKLRLGPSGIGVIRAAEAVLAESTGYPSDTIREGIGDAIRGGWLRRERSVYWLVNALRYEPSRSLNNGNHVKNLKRYLAGLPKVALVNDFARYYGLPEPFILDTPSDGIPNPIGDHGIRNTENGIRNTESSLSAREDLKAWSEIDMAKIRGLYGYEGSEGVDPILVKAFEEPAERDRCLDIAMKRYGIEGKEYHGRFFRSILKAVVEEQSGSGDAYDDVDPFD